MVNPAAELIETAWDCSGGPDHFDIEKYKHFIKIYKDNNGDTSNYEKALHSRFKNQANWLEYNLKRACRIECVDDEEQELGEKVVINVLKDIFKYNELLQNKIL